jgi:hypothetical protein
MLIRAERMKDEEVEKMGKLVMKKRWCISYKIFGTFFCLLWALHFGSASGLFSDSGSSLKFTSPGIEWATSVEKADEGAENNGESDGNNQEVADTEVEAAFPSIDSMLQWAIGRFAFVSQVPRKRSLTL